MHRHAEHGHRRHGNFQHRATRRLPGIRPQRTKALADFAEELLPLLLLLAAEARFEEVVRSGDGPEKCRKGRAVVLVAAAGENPQNRWGEAIARPAKADGMLPRDALDDFLSRCQFALDFLFCIEMQPRLV